MTININNGELTALRYALDSILEMSGNLQYQEGYDNEFGTQCIIWYLR